MRIDPKHLNALAEIVDCGGFTDAAAAMGTTQPALSRVVKHLEARVGEPLFVRTRKPIELTAMGRALVEQGRSIREAAARATDSIQRIQSGNEAELRIGGTPFFIDGFVSGLIAEFQRDHPRITVQLSYGYSDDLVSGLLGGKLDAALCPVNVVDPDVDVEFMPLIEGRNVVACRVGHPLLEKRRLTARDLIAYPWVEPPPRSPLATDLKNALISIGAERIRIAFSGGGLGSVISYLTHSDSLAVLPHTVVFEMRKQNTITALPYEIPHPSRSLSLVRARGHVMSRAEERFYAHIQESVAQLRDLIRRHENIVVWKR